MMKNKMAIAVAGAMLATNVAPILSNAAVVEYKTDINDAAALEALRTELKGYFDTKYTEDATLLADADKAGKCVYTIKVGNTPIKSLAEFDAHVNDLEEGYDFTLTIKDKGFKKNSDEEIVDNETVTYKNLDKNNDGKPDYSPITGANISTEISNTYNQIQNHQEVVLFDSATVTGVDTQTVVPANESRVLKNIFTNAPVINGNQVTVTVNNVTINDSGVVDNLVITLNEDSEVLDLTKPILGQKVVKYTDASTSQIKTAKVNVLLGFESAKTPIAPETTVDKVVTVENNNDATSATIKASELYSEGRLTIEGQKLVNALNEKLTNSKGEFLKTSVNNQNFEVTKQTGVNAETTATNMYQYAFGAIKTVSATKSEMTLTIKAFDGYRYQNDLLVGEDETIFELTITGTNKELSDLSTTTLPVGANAELINGVQYKIGMTPVVDVTVYAGEDRYTTAVEVSKANWQNGSRSAVLVAGNGIADGLAAAPLAAVLQGEPTSPSATTYNAGAPILLTDTEKLPMEVKREIKRLGVKEVYITGGLISEDVVEELESMDITVERIAGDDRFATSLEIAKKVDEIGGDINKVYIAGGYAEADTLSISAFAAQQKTPVILTPQEGLTDDQLAFLESEKLDRTATRIVGGKNSVSENVEAQLDDIDVKARRYEGKDRQHTNALIINEYADPTTNNNPNADINNLYVVKSDNKGFVDALAAGAVASKNNTAVGATKNMVVIATDSLSEDQKLALGKLDVVGGTGANKDKVNLNKKYQIGNGIAEAVIKAINSIVK